ncbi:MAG: (Fe-S)-binding protein [Promethearchaeota archaeon]
MVLELVREILERCVRCGKCRAQCPSLEANDDGAPNWEIYSPRGRMELACGLLKGEIEPTKKLQDALFTCFVCNQCVETCPSMARIHEVVLETRKFLIAGGNASESVLDTQEVISESKNMFDMDQDERVELWSMDVEELVEDRLNVPADFLYFVGCQASFRGNLVNIPVKVVQILDRLGESFTLLGEDEQCCGDPLQLTGAPEEALIALARHNVEKIESLGVKEVLYTCPGCLRMISQEYPRLLGRELKFKNTMISEYLLSKIESGDLVLHELEGEGKVVYHDPCELGRHMKIYEPPRDLLKSIPGIDYVEFADNRENSNCCGMGGGVAMHDISVSLHQARRKAGDIEDTGASTVVTHCPACFQGISNASKVLEGRNKEIKVVDIVELVAKSLGIED